MLFPGSAWRGDRLSSRSRGECRARQQTGAEGVHSSGPVSQRWFLVSKKVSPEIRRMHLAHLEHCENAVITKHVIKGFLSFIWYSTETNGKSKTKEILIESLKGTALQHAEAPAP